VNLICLPDDDEMKKRFHKGLILIAEEISEDASKLLAARRNKNAE